MAQQVNRDPTERRDGAGMTDLTRVHRCEREPMGKRDARRRREVTEARADAWESRGPGRMAFSGLEDDLIDEHKTQPVHVQRSVLSKADARGIRLH